MKFSRQLVGSVAVIVIILVDTTVSFVKTGAKLPVLERTGIGVNELFHVIAQERGEGWSSNWGSGSNAVDSRYDQCVSGIPKASRKKLCRNGRT